MIMIAAGSGRIEVERAADLRGRFAGSLPAGTHLERYVDQPRRVADDVLSRGPKSQRRDAERGALIPMAGSCTVGMRPIVSDVLTNEPRPAEAAVPGVSRTPRAPSAAVRAPGGRRRSAAPPSAPGDPLARVLARAVAERQLSGGNPLLQRATLYRGMQASATDAQKPLIGTTGSSLGVRDGEANEDANGNVVANNGGMSTTNRRDRIPSHTVSKAYTSISGAANKGHNQQDPTKPAFRAVWSIDDTTLPPQLQTRNDHANHVLIEPSGPMTLVALRAALAATQGSWVRSPPP